MDDRLIFDNGVARLKHCRYGPMLYPAGDIYIGRSLDTYGEFSEGEAHLFREFVKPGQVVLDVGANIGAHTVVLAQLAGPSGAVLAFEPQRVLYQMLCGNLALNGLFNVQAKQCAVGASPGQTRLPRLDYTKENNFGGAFVDANQSGEVVPAVAIDDLKLNACHFVKIDVEGAEGEVLAGAEQTIRRLRPCLYVENDREDRSKALINQILGLNYRLYWHLPRLFNPNNFYQVQENVFGAIVSANMLCIPAEAPQQINMREITSPDDFWKSK